MRRSPLIWIFALALLVRLAVLVAGPWGDLRRASEPDSGRYLLLAENLEKYGRFGKHQEDGIDSRAIAALRQANGTLPAPDEHGLRPESFRTPGYPVFIAVISGMFGSLRAVLLVQCLLGALMACAVVAIGRALKLPERAAIAAGLIWSLHPGLIVYDTLFMAENVFNAGLVTSLWLLARWRQARGALAAGLLIGLATLVRPLGILFIPAAVAMAWHIRPRRALVLTGLIAMAVVPPLLWTARNYAVGEGFRLSPVAEQNLLISTAAYSISEARGEDWLRNWPARLDDLFGDLGRRLSPGEDVYAGGRRLALEVIAANPASVARVHLKSVFKLAIDHSLNEGGRVLGTKYQSTGLFSRFVLRQSGPTRPGSGAIAALALGWMTLNALIAVAAFLAVALAISRRSWTLAVTGGVTIGLFVLATGSVGLERFRLPMMLPLSLLAGSFVHAAGRRSAIKTAARALATVAVIPALLSFRIRARLLGPDRALEGSTQVLALLPGIIGQYLRRAFLARVLAGCHASATIEFGTIFSQTGARIDENAYVGPRCHLGLVHIGRDALLAAGVHVPSGPLSHGIVDPSVSIREQNGAPRLVHIGAGTWIGSAAIVMADVGRHTIVGAGAVVTRPLPDSVVAVGVPARVVRSRTATIGRTA